MPGGEKVSIADFAAKIKEKYPQYKDVNDTVLTSKIIEKYPAYKEQVDYQPQPEPPEPKPKESDAFLSTDPTGGLIKPVGTYENKEQPVLDPIEQMASKGKMENGLLTVHDNTVPKSDLPDIGEAIDNTISKKNKGFTVNDNGIKVQKDALAKSYKDGDLILKKDSKGRPVLKKNPGVLGMLVDALKQGKHALDQGAIDRADNENLLSLNTQGKIDYLKAKSLDKPYPAPTSYLGEGTKIAGQNADVLAKGIVGGMTGGTMAPELLGSSTVGSLVNMIQDFAKGGAGNSIQKTFAELKQQNPDMSDQQAMQKAESTQNVGAATGIASGVALSSSGPAVNGLIMGIVKSASKMGVVSGAETLVNDLNEINTGVKKSVGDVLVDVRDNALHGAALGAAFHILENPGKVISALRPQAENVIASIPKEQRDALLKAATTQGVMEKPVAEKINAKVDEFAKAKEPFDNLPIPEENKAALAGKSLQKQKLVDEKNNLAKHGEAFLPRIEELDKQIQGIEKDMAGMYNAKDVFDKEKDNLTGEKINDVSNGENQTGAAADIAGETPTPIKEGETLPSNEGAAPQETPVEVPTINNALGGKTATSEPATNVPDQNSVITNTNTDALQEPSSSGILQHSPEATGETGSERGGVEPVKQGEEATGTRQENVGNNSESQAKEVKPVTEFKSKNGHILKSENGVVEVTKADGKPVSRPTRKKVIREAAQAYDFTQGREAPDAELSNPEEHTRHVIENSTSPSEIASLYINEQPESAGLNSKEQMIADYGVGKITEESYRRHGDRNNQNHNKARAYFSKNGTPLDSLAKEISDHYETEITPEDIAEFIDRFPNGADAALAERETRTAQNAKDRFSELTGLPLDEEIAGIAIKQQFDKLSKQEQAIAQQDYETRKQLEDEYWKHAADYPTEQVDGSTENGAGGKTEPGAQNESQPEADPNKPITNREAAEQIAKEILSWRSSGNNLYGGLAGVTTAVYDGMLSAAANAVRAGGSLLDAIDAGLNYVRSSAPRADLEKVKEFLHNQFKVPYTKPTATPNALMKGVDVADTAVRLRELDKSRDEIEKEIKNRKLSWWDKFAKATFEGQQEILKRLGEMGKKGNVVRDYLITSKGSTAKADAIYDQAKDAIYGGINGFKKIVIGGERIRVKSLLNKIVTLRRIIDIDQKMSDKFDEFSSLKTAIGNLKSTNPKDPKLIQLQRDYESVKDYLDYNGVLNYDNKTNTYSLGQYKHPFGYTSDFAKQDLANIQQEHPELHKQLDDRATLLSKTFHSLIDMKEGAGILSKESADALRQYFYAPRRDIDTFINSETDNSSGGGQSVKDRVGIKRLQGGSEDIISDDYDVQLHKAVANTMRDIALNNSGKKLLDAIRGNPDNKYLYENTPQIHSNGPNEGRLVRDKYGNIKFDEIPSGKSKIKVWEDGKPVEIIGDQRLVDSWYDAYKTNRFVKIAGNITGAKFIRAAITGYNPGFGIFQLLVDPQSAVVASGLYKSYIGGLATVYKDMIKVSPKVFALHGVTGVAAEARDYGAFTSFSRGEDVFNLRSDLSVNKHRAARAVRGLLEGFNWVNDRAENLTRTALYSRSKDLQIAEYKKANGADPQGQDLEDIRTQAAHDARRYVDFARGGDLAKEANNIFPYLNAAIQLKRSVLHAAAKNPIRMASMASEAVAAGLGVMAYSLGLGWASHGLSEEEKRKRLEAYRNVNPVTRSKYFLLYKGEDKDGKPQFWRPEKPMLLNVAINAAEKAMIQHYYPDVDLSAQSFLQDMADQSPVDQTIIGRNPMASAILKYYGNKDWYFNKEVVKNADNITDYLEGTDNKKTKDFYILLGKKAKDIGIEGGISPMRTQAAVETFTGDPTQNPIINLLTGTMAMGMDAALGNKKSLDERVKALGELGTYLDFTTFPKRLIVQPSDVTVEELKNWKDRGERRADAKVMKKAAQLGRTP